MIDENAELSRFPYCAVAGRIHHSAFRVIIYSVIVPTTLWLLMKPRTRLFLILWLAGMVGISVVSAGGPECSDKCNSAT
jgi:hypothetical protein